MSNQMDKALAEYRSQIATALSAIEAKHDFTGIMSRVAARHGVGVEDLQRRILGKD